MGIGDRQKRAGRQSKRKDVVISFRMPIEEAELLEEMLGRAVVHSFPSLGALVRHYLRTEAFRKR